MIEGNLATTIFLGRWLTLNPIAIILSFLLWSYLWGVVGTLLAVPILATFNSAIESNRCSGSVHS
jgi:predicted PurR-regulated permease PerM